MESFSIVIPSHNEAESLTELMEAIRAGCSGKAYEVIIVDDSSTDNTQEVLAGLEQKYKKIVTKRIDKKSSKGDALREGVASAKYDIIVTIDSDLQDNPAEIPQFIAKLEEGYDLVVGWRKERQESKLKIRASNLYNRIMRAYSGLELHDFNCGFKAFRKKILRDVKLEGNSHRFFTLSAILCGYKTTEIVISNSPRKYGKSKYSILKYFAFSWDLLKYLRSH